MTPASSSDPNTILQEALSQHRSGNLSEAATLYQQLLDLLPKNPMILKFMGILEFQRGKFSESAKLLESSLQADPGQADALSSLGAAYQHLNLLEKAVASFDKAITLNPDLADAYSNRGFALNGLNRFDEALQSCDKAISLNPDHVEAYNNRGLALLSFKRFDEALESFDHAISLRSDVAILHNNRGLALSSLERFKEALESFDRAITLQPDFAEAHTNRGKLLSISLNRFEEAIASFDRAIALRPDYAEAYCQRGYALMQKFDQYQDALNDLGRAIDLNPDYAEAYNHRGVILYRLNKISESLENFDHALALDPDFALANWNKSFLELLTGNFETGWKLYEWRWKTDHFIKHERNFPQPLWLGEQPISGKTLLIHPEQGLGDFIQFCRYIPMACTLGAKIIVEVPPGLISLVSTLKADFTIVMSGDALPHFDLHCPIASLPLAFKTTMQSIPASVPYLYADAGKLKSWRQRLGKKTKPRVGLAWSGLRTQNQYLLQRAIPLQLLEPLLQFPIELHALQKDIWPDDEKLLSGLFTKFRKIHLHQKELHDFSDTAALVNEMDLIISVDTAVAHLAGAMNKPAWILLPYVPDYRWLQDGTDSPWYPSATLFRQPAYSDWDSVIIQIATKIKANLSHLQGA